MTRRKIVVALGGNAIQSGDGSAQAQQEALERTAEQLVKILENDADIVITHGNGPQVGTLLLQQKIADSTATPAMPLDTCPPIASQEKEPASPQNPSVKISI